MIDIGLEDKKREEVAQRLNRLLANQFVLYTKTLKAHWNVEGKHFGALHKFFEEQYEQLFTIIDETAERVRALGVMSLGTLEEYKRSTSLAEEPGNNPDDLTFIHRLLIDHEHIIKQMRNDIDFCNQVNDQGTSNFLSDTLEVQEKMAWMLRAHLIK